MGRSRRYNSFYNNSDSSDSGLPKRKHRYRVRMRQVANTPQTVWVTNDVKYACSIAARLNIVASEGIAWVEEWDFAKVRGRWIQVQEATELSSVKFSIRRATPRSGELVRAVLLDNRTRRGGWRARLLESNLEGPITNSDNMPTSLVPGQTVELLVGASNRDGTHLQLSWRGKSGGIAR